MIDLTEKIGFDLKFDENKDDIIIPKEISYEKKWEKTLIGNFKSGDYLWKSLKIALNYTDNKGNITNEPNLNLFYKTIDYPLYYGYNNIFLNEFKPIIKKNNLIPDLTILPSGKISNEYIRTEGHKHLSGLPEVYEVLYGNAIFLLFKENSINPEDIEEVIGIYANPGDHVVFLPGYQHISINIGKSYFIMTDWNSINANSDFKYIKLHNGAPYHVLNNRNIPEFKLNPKYTGKIPKIRLCKPSETIPEFGLEKNKPMFNLAKSENSIRKLDFINNPHKYTEIFKKIYVDL